MVPRTFKIKIIRLIRHTLTDLNKQWIKPSHQQRYYNTEIHPFLTKKNKSTFLSICHLKLFIFQIIHNREMISGIKHFKNPYQKNNYTLNRIILH